MDPAPRLDVEIVSTESGSQLSAPQPAAKRLPPPSSACVWKRRRPAWRSAASQLKRLRLQLVSPTLSACDVLLSGGSDIPPKPCAVRHAAAMERSSRRRRRTAFLRVRCLRHPAIDHITAIKLQAAIWYRAAGSTSDSFGASARRARSYTCQSEASGNDGIVTSSPRSRPASAASTISGAGITTSDGRLVTGRPADGLTDFGRGVAGAFGRG